jgi:hypothetical protein
MNMTAEITTVFWDVMLCYLVTSYQPSSEILVPIYKVTWCHVTEHSKFHSVIIHYSTCLQFMSAPNTSVRQPWTVLLQLYLKTRSRTKTLMQFINSLYIYIIQKFQSFNIYFTSFVPSYIYKYTPADTNTGRVLYNFRSLASILSSYSCDSFCSL